jgi:type I restriction enzyme M protein
MKEIKSQRENHFARKEKVLGQFMTPREVANFIVDFTISSLNRKPELGIDPACGDGAFLEAMSTRGISQVVGIDIDEKIAPKNPKYKIFTPKNGLLPLDEQYEGRADIVVGNPPFSAKYGRVKDEEILSRFELGRGKKSQAIEILFLERFIQLVSSGGVIGIILPSGIFSNLPLKPVREYICRNTSILGIVSLPRAVFKGTKSTTSKTHILFARKQPGNGGKVFMAVVNKLSDLPSILESYRKKEEIINPSTFWVKLNPENMSPDYYFSSSQLTSLESSQKVARLGELITEMFCGKTEYGPKRLFTASGVHYISAKTITPLGVDFTKEDRGRLYVDPKSEMYKPKAHAKVGDLLFVRVGVGCIGRAAVITDTSEEGVVDDWIYIIRTLDKLMAYYLAFYLQSKYGRLQLEKMKRGVGTVTIPQSLLKNFLIPVPPKHVLEKFEKLYHRMVELRKSGEIEEAKKIFTETLEWIEKEANQWWR